MKICFSESKMASPPEEVDETKIDIAARFLSNSNVMETEKENQESFLRNKGLNEKEIALAFSRVAELKEHEKEMDSSWSFFDYMKYLVLGSGILSVANFAYKAYVLPYATRELKDDARMEILVESFQDVKDDIKQHTYELTGTLKQMQTLMEENQKNLVAINASLKSAGACETTTSSTTAAGVSSLAVGELKSEISMIKSMMLSKEQFRTTPFTSIKPTKTNEIPAWQKIADDMVAGKEVDENNDGAVSVGVIETAHPVNSEIEIVCETKEETEQSPSEVVSAVDGDTAVVDENVTSVDQMTSQGETYELVNNTEIVHTIEGAPGDEDNESGHPVAEDTN